MKSYVYWFLAAVEDAAAIRSVVTTEERKREEWPHLVLPRVVDGPDMNKLDRLARPKRRKGETKIGGELLDRSKMTDSPFTAVSRVAPELIQVLATLDESATTELARAWVAAIEGVTEDAAVDMIRQMSGFAQQAVQAGKPVLELILM